GGDYAVLKNFTYSDAANPGSDLVLSGSTLYGPTFRGGGWNGGAIFKLNTDGSGYGLIKEFNCCVNSPFALVLSSSVLYGTTWDTVFTLELDSFKYNALTNFTSIDFMGSQRPLVLSGSTLYGTAYSGTVFKVNTDGSDYTVLYSFTNGHPPSAGLVLSDGK